MSGLLKSGFNTGVLDKLGYAHTGENGVIKFDMKGKFSLKAH